MGPDHLGYVRDWMAQQEYFTLGRVVVGMGMAAGVLVLLLGVGVVCERVQQWWEERR